MKLEQVPHAGVAQLISAYQEAARQHGDASEDGDYKTANKSAGLIAAIYAELRRQGLAAQKELLSLLASPTPGVRLWSASHALEFSPDEGERVLSELAMQRQVLGLSAATTLKEWREGRLHFQ